VDHGPRYSDREDVGLTPISTDPAARPPVHDLGGYCAQPPRFKSRGKQASPPQAVAGSTRWGLRVEAVDSFEGGFVGVH
jgi:hypothetical protein